MQEFNRKKFEELILLIARECEDHNYFGATKLNKILFFADFGAYSELGKSITGAEYIAIEHGPVPRLLKPIRHQMLSNGDIRLERRGNQERIVPKRQVDENLFSAAEAQIVFSVIRELESSNADSVSDLSHKFLGWQAGWAERLETGSSPTIPYESVFVSNRRPTVAEISEVAPMAKEHGWSFK